MAEYIERAALLELINEDCKYKNPTNEYTRGCNEVCDWAIKTIKNIPTADVVPKSEVVQLKHDVMRLMEENARLAKSQFPPYVRVCREDEAIDIGRQYGRKEVAREIFEEIEQEILSAIDNNLKRMAEQDSANEIWRMCVSKKNTLCGIYDFIAELKKKYTEENKDDNQN